MSLKITETTLLGCYLIESPLFQDARGSFAKVFHADSFLEKGLSFCVKEQFFTLSKKNVLRGMHFQTPPHDHMKLVTCISGHALDVVLDIRQHSPTYGHFFSVELSSERGMSVFIPKGMAHGFLSLQNNTGMLYSTTYPHVPESDAGIHWNSFGFNWPCFSPIVSDRDALHIQFGEFKTPFNDVANMDFK